MRIGIREQLGLLVLVTSLVPLVVLALATWFNNYDFTVNIKEGGLSLTASLKASQIAADLLLIQSTCSTIVTRILLQEALRNYYAGNISESNWTNARSDVDNALASGGLSSLLQIIIFSRNQTGPSSGILSVTANETGKHSHCS
jgi:osomolarity two-component system sensor histidine kinase SLN1